MLRASDVSLVTFDDTLVTNCSLPQRAVISLAAGVPVITLPLKGLLAEFGEVGLNVVASHTQFFDPKVLGKLKRPLVSRVSEMVSTESSVADFERMLIETCHRYN